ncbi:MAG TPA: malic enzyme-like NAD(P)-binding protein [Candidatus Azoamicus sp. OHIO1]
MSLIKLNKSALKYHLLPKPGKIGINVIKPAKTYTDLSLAYTPGVAEPVKEIRSCLDNVYKYTSKGNLVAVITNGSAVLGLGNVGPEASKPVMEGKAVLFKQFSGIDVFDIEINASSPAEFIDTVIRISPTFGGINLEDIKAPECFEIESKLIKALNIPVLHDDQHGTAVVIAAGLLNALYLQDKKINNIKLVCFGAGAAGIATMKLLVKLGLKKNNIYMVDRGGVIHVDRLDINSYKLEFATKTVGLSLYDIVMGSDVFIGVSSESLFTPKMLKSMNSKPIVFALSNPISEIHPDIANSIRKDLIMATGRSDFVNQVNNVLCFPYLFRGALDVRASCINEEMLIASVHAIKDLARKYVPSGVVKFYNCNKDLKFGSSYILPRPVDPRLMKCVSSAVSDAAIRTGIAKYNFNK